MGQALGERTCSNFGGDSSLGQTQKIIVSGSLIPGQGLPDL